jgi:hypothetical protein
MGVVGTQSRELRLYDELRARHLFDQPTVVGPITALSSALVTPPLIGWNVTSLRRTAYTNVLLTFVLPLFYLTAAAFLYRAAKKVVVSYL